MSANAIVLVNGEITSLTIIRQRIRQITDAIVVGVDGGSRHAPALGLKPDMVVGDMDSISSDILSALADRKVERVTAHPEKDETDLELALIHLAGTGVKRIILIAALGGRFDMSLANVMLLLHPALIRIKIELWHEKQTCWLLRPPGEEICGKKGDTVSLIPLGGDVTGIQLTGFVYPLKKETLHVGPARGVSNILSGDHGEIAFDTGDLLVVHTPGHA
jgi:thiamine pyrophosphokinase